MKDYVYDIEVYPNVFTITIDEWSYEISHRRNDIDQIIQLLQYIRYHKGRMVGFNNLGYDYPVLHYVINHRPCNTLIYNFSKSIIDSKDRFSHIIWDRDQYVPQVDLFKIHHFDNPSKATSLKVLQFNMRSQSIQDLPFPPGMWLADHQIDELIKYNQHDVEETRKFHAESLDEIRFREELTEKYGKNFINYNDTKIGKEYFIMRLEESNPGCTRVNGKPRQTHRASIDLSEAVLAYINFIDPEFNRITNYLKQQVITKTKGVFKGLVCNVGGINFKFGTGGIHASVQGRFFESDNDGQIIDVDVTSFYPSVAIINQFRPEHLGELFCSVYADVKKERLMYEKGTTENKALKLALNGTFGDTNNHYSPFYDPKCTMQITINGQLLLCMLADRVLMVPGLQLIQANTDGITVKCPHQHVDYFRQICHWWEQYACLDLEEALYTRMWVKNVNNYAAEYEGTGKLKLKGVYLDKPEWNKNHSALVIPKAVKAAITDNVDVEHFIYNHQDPMDFLLRTKVPKTSILLHGNRQIQNVSRYYISNDGQPLTKVMPPTKKKPGVNRPIGINVGWLATECNEWSGSLHNLNYRFYIEEARKLLI